MVNQNLQTQPRSHVRLILLVLTLLLVSACGNSKKVVTKDDSADYKSARSLPPLKKPSRVVIPRQAEPVQAQPIQAEPIQAEPIQAEPIQTAGDEADLLLGSDNQATEMAAENTANQVPTSIDSTDDAPAQASLDNSKSLTARVISPNEGISRMQIEADFDSAWAYLGDNLKRSDVTVYSRNEAAGRISIGCGDIESAAVVEKRGGWSFITRKKTEQLEYCALQAVSTRGVTVVTVLNRAGQEVSGEYAARVFQRILNN